MLGNGKHILEVKVLTIKKFEKFYCYINECQLLVDKKAKERIIKQAPESITPGNNQIEY